MRLQVVLEQYASQLDRLIVVSETTIRVRQQP
jgi:hypothetical protein